MKKRKTTSFGLSVLLVAGVLASAYGVSIASHTLAPQTALHSDLFAGGSVIADYKGILELFGGKFVGVGQGKNGSWYTFARPVNNDNCVFCHGNKKVESSPAMGMGESAVSAHKKHFFSVLLKFYVNSAAPNIGGSDGVADTGVGCAFCHKKVATGYENDLSYSITTAWDRPIRKTADPRRCVNCHGNFRLERSTAGAPVNVLHTTDGAKTDSYHCTPLPTQDPNSRGPYAAGACGAGSYSVAAVDPRGCNRCHNNIGGVAGDPVADHSAASSPGKDYVNQGYEAIGNFCLKCHGGLNWFEVLEANYSDTFNN